MIKNPLRKFTAHTCFIGEKENGSREWLGCLKWGFKYTGSNKNPEVEPDPVEPEWSCGKPPAMDEAIELWNKQNPKFRVPKIQ
jgi:hypothetical protein